MENKIEIGSRVICVKSNHKGGDFLIGKKGTVTSINSGYDYMVSFDNSCVAGCNADEIELVEIEKEQYEFGEKIGSLAWAYKVAEKEGEVYHNNIKIILIHNEMRFEGIDGKFYNYLSYMQVQTILTGWSRKPELTPKEELTEGLFKVWSKASGNLKGDFEDLLKDFEITRVVKK